MNEYEENYTLLRNLKECDEFISKSNTIGFYVKSIGEDKHILKSEDGNCYEVPHGGFPVFKKINNPKQK